MKLLSKIDGHILMVSAFCSDTFGFGLLLSNEEVNELNEMRQSNE